jgi:hypothetical protein
MCEVHMFCGPLRNEYRPLLSGNEWALVRERFDAQTSLNMAAFRSQ